MKVVAPTGVEPIPSSQAAPDHAAKPLSWSEFSRIGINTYTGNMSAKDATGQVLILPVLILVWGLAIAVIAAAVR